MLRAPGSTVSVALGSGRIPAWALSLMAFHLANLQFALVAQMVKHLSAVWETQVRSLGWEDPLQKGMAIHSSILAWRIPWTEEPGGPWGHKESDMTKGLTLLIC